MLSVAPASSIYVYTRPTDMRKGFDGLCGLVRQELGGRPAGWELVPVHQPPPRPGEDPVWDRDGLALCYKRLEAGSLEGIESGDSASVQINATQLAMLLSGVSLAAAKERRKRYRQAA